MNMQQLERALQQSLTDWKLSAGERQAMLEVLADISPNSGQTAAIRSLVFRVFAREIADPLVRERLGWLEDIIKLLHPVEQSALSSEALFAPQDPLVERVCALIESTKQNLDVCVFTITDDRLTNSILNAAQRGVRVRIVSDNDKAEDLGSDIVRLAEAGIPIRFDRTEAHMHHKFALFDGRLLLTGSYNWTRSADAVNNENILLTSDSRLVKAFHREFERLWKQFN